MLRATKHLPAQRERPCAALSVTPKGNTSPLRLNRPPEKHQPGWAYTRIAYHGHVYASVYLGGCAGTVLLSTLSRWGITPLTRIMKERMSKVINNESIITAGK